MGLGLNWTGAAAGYNAYRDEVRQQKEDERRAAADAARAQDQAFQEEQRSRQRYEWSEVDRIKAADRKADKDYLGQFDQPAATTASAPVAPTAAAPELAAATAAPAAQAPPAPAPAAAGTAPAAGMQTFAVPNPTDDITPAPLVAAKSHAAPLDAALAGAPPAHALAQSDAPSPAPAAPMAASPAQNSAQPQSQGQPAQPPAQGTAAVGAPGVEPVAGIPKPHQMASVLGMYANRLELSAKRGDTNMQTYAQARELLAKMQAEGVTQATQAFDRGDFAGGMALYNGLGDNRSGRIVGNPVQTETTLPTGEKVPTWKLTVANGDGSRAEIDTALNLFQTMDLKERLALMDKAATRKETADFHKGTLDIQRQQANTQEGYRHDQADNMREQRRLQEEALKAKTTQSAEQAANWTKEADAYLVATTKAKDMDGNETYDGDGFTFAKTVGLDYARQHGGDAMSGAGVAVGVNNQVKAIAAANVAKDPKLNLAKEMQRLRNEYLVHATRTAPPAQAAQATGDQASFASTYGPAAQRAGAALGVDPNVLLGQWGLETGWGKSIIPGTNNLGNIKDFTGSGVAATDNQTGSVDKYRAYDSPEAFADNYVDLIRRKYPGALNAGADVARFAGALKAGGYAEDPDYVSKVQAGYRMLSAPPAPAQQRTTASAPPGGAPAAPRVSPEQMAERDRQMEAFNRTVGGGRANDRHNAAMDARRTDVAENFDTVLTAIRPGAPRAEIQRALAWVDQMSDAGVLNNQQLKQVREARAAAHL